MPAGALDGQLRAMRDRRRRRWPARAGIWWSPATWPAPPRPTHLAGASAAAGPRQSSAPRELEFVLQISRFPWGEDPLGWLTAVAGAASDAGFAGVALMDHLIQIPQVGRAWEPIPGAVGEPGRCSAPGFPTLRLGSLVSPVTFREPGLLAKTVATVDALTGGGRVFCGLGAGWWGREHAAFGLPFPAPRRAAGSARGDHRDAARAVVVGNEGVQRSAVWRCRRPPAIRGRSTPIPIVVGGAGPRTLRIAARMADGCNVRTAELAAALPVLRSELDRIGPAAPTRSR